VDPLAEIRHLYFSTTRATIGRDFARAVELLKAMSDEEARERATVYMEGLAQMRNEWSAVSKPGRKPAPGRRRG